MKLEIYFSIEKRKICFVSGIISTKNLQVVFKFTYLLASLGNSIRYCIVA